MNGISPGTPPPTATAITATALGIAQEAAIALGGAWNAAYFVLRVREGSRGRRLAAGLLAVLFASVAMEALIGLPVRDTGVEVTRRTPLLLATLGIAAVVSYRPRGGAR